MDRAEILDRLDAAGARPDAEIDLGETALLFAAAEYPELDLAREVGLFDSLARAASRAVDGDSPLGAANALSRFLFDDLGFAGNQRDYYDPRNSYVNEVLKRRLGIPITLSLIYIEVGKHLGIGFFGIGMPGHFLVRHQDLSDMFIDPFYGGIILSVEECAQRLRQITSADVHWSQAYLSPISNLEFIARMLRNLKATYWRRQDFNRALRVIDWLMALHPADLQERRDRGLLYAQTGRHVLALNDLERYVASKPSTKEASQARELMRQLKRSVSN